MLLDNDTANRIAELEEEIANKADKSNTTDQIYIEDRHYLRKIVALEEKRVIRLYYNLWGQWEGNKTADNKKRQAILRKYQKRRFTKYNSTTFPILWFSNMSAEFVSTEKKKILNEIFEELPKKYAHDRKALTEALLNPIKFEYLLTCNRRHLAADKLQSKIKEKGLQLKICTPKVTV